MMIIDADKNYFTLINTFTADAANQHRLVELLSAVTNESVSKVNGFVAAALHKSLDGTKVTMYAQWQSEAHYRQMRSNSESSSSLEEALKIAQFEMGAYEVVDVFKRK